MRNKRVLEILSSVRQPCRLGRRRGALGGVSPLLKGGQLITPGVTLGRSDPGFRWYQPMPSLLAQAAMPWLQSHRLRLHPKINWPVGWGDTEALKSLF